MIAKMLNWMTREGGWKLILFAFGFALLLVGLATGVIWYFLAGSVCAAPKMIEELKEINGKGQRREDLIEKKADRKIEEIKTNEENRERQEQKEQQKADRKREETLPRERSAEEIANQIIKETDEPDDF